MNPINNISLSRCVLLILCGLLSLQQLRAQLTSGEYFFDTDPGVSQGTPFSLPTELFVDGAFTFDTEGLEAGVHLLGVRVKDAGLWGFTETIEFYVEPETLDETNRGFIKGEYFIDTDPGVGSATSFAVEAGAWTENELDIDLSALAAGDHIVGVRFQNTDKVWSFAEISAFTIEPEDGVDQDYLTEVGYNIYNSAGEPIKSGSVLVDNRPTSIDTDLDIDIAGLIEGEYTLETFVKNEEGLRGFDQSLLFSVIDGNAPESLNLSNSSVDGNQSLGTVIGSLSTEDIDEGDTHQYTLVAGEGDVDNASFEIVGVELRTAEVFDFATRNSYSIRVRSTDLGELFTEQMFTITVTDNKEAQTITFETINIDTYGDTETLSATTSSGLDITYSSSNPSIATVTGNEMMFTGVGEVVVSASQAGNDAFASTTVAQTVQVSKAALSATAEDKSKVYGEDNPVLTILYAGFVNSEDQNSLTEQPVVSTTATVSSGAGNYDISLLGGLSDNYDLTLVNGTLTVSKAALSVTADDKSRLYGADNPEFTMTYSGFVNGDDENSLTAQPEITAEASITSGAGNYDINLTGGSSDNYEFNLTNGLLTVNKAALIAVADDQSRKYGENNPAFTISYSGFVNGDDAGSLTEQPAISTVADETSAVGVYDIDLAQGMSDNYELSLTGGQLTITKADLTVVADNQSRAYGEANPQLTISYSGFVNGDDVSSLTTEPGVSTLASVDSPPGNYAINLSGGLDDNYDLDLTNGQLTISKASLVATADNKIRVYGQGNPELTISYTGFVLGDDANDLTNLPIATTLADNTSDAGNYTISLTGGEDANYAFDLTDGELSITKAVLIAEAEDATRNKGEENPDFSIVYSGFINGDDLDDIDSAPVASATANSASDRGTYDIVLSGGTDNNYSFDFQNGSLLVTGPVFSLPASIDFGNINKDESATESVNVANTGDGLLNVSSINLPPGFSADQAAFELVPGASTTIVITFSPTEGKVYTGNLVLTSNDGTDLIALSGEGMLVTGVDDKVLDDEEVKMYPNPAVNELTIDLTAGPSGSVNFSLIDPQGQERLSLTDVRERRITLDVSSYRMGIYLLRIEGRKGTVFKKVMIER